MTHPDIREVYNAASPKRRWHWDTASPRQRLATLVMTGILDAYRRSHETAPSSRDLAAATMDAYARLHGTVGWVTLAGGLTYAEKQYVALAEALIESEATLPAVTR